MKRRATTGARAMPTSAPSSGPTPGPARGPEVAAADPLQPRRCRSRRCTGPGAAALGVLLLTLSVIPALGQGLRPGSSSAVDPSDPGIEHDPSASVSEEQSRRISIYDSRRRAADPAASHLPTIFGPLDAEAGAEDARPAVTPVTPISTETLYGDVDGGSLADVLATPGPAVRRRPTARRPAADPGAIAPLLVGLDAPVTVRAYSHAAETQVVPGSPSGNASGIDASGADASGVDGGELDRGRVLLAGGTTVYAALALGIESRHPGPVVATLLAGPLKGGRLFGGFDAADDAMVLRFDRLVLSTGAPIAVDAYGVDPDCRCYAIAGSVDHHWFARVILPAAAGFAQRFLETAARPGNTGCDRRVHSGNADWLE